MVEDVQREVRGWQGGNPHHVVSKEFLLYELPACSYISPFIWTLLVKSKVHFIILTLFAMHLDLKVKVQSRVEQSGRGRKIDIICSPKPPRRFVPKPFIRHVLCTVRKCNTEVQQLCEKCVKCVGPVARHCSAQLLNCTLCPIVFSTAFGAVCFSIVPAWQKTSRLSSLRGWLESPVTPRMVRTRMRMMIQLNKFQKLGSEKKSIYCPSFSNTYQHFHPGPPANNCESHTGQDRRDHQLQLLDNFPRIIRTPYFLFVLLFLYFVHWQWIV